MGTSPLASNANHPPKTQLNIYSLTKIQDSTPLVLWMDPEGKFYEQYKIFVHAENSFHQLLSAYQLRLMQHQNIIGIHFYQIINRQFESSGYLQLEVFTERIPLKLSQVKQLAFEDGLEILTQSATGFEVISKYTGPFEINDSLIGFDNKKNVKVWLNGNWALNTKLIPKKIRSCQITQHNMIQRLIQTVEQHISLSAIYAHWLDKRKQCHDWSFSKLRQTISSFKQKHRIQLKGVINLSGRGISQEHKKREYLCFKTKSTSPQQNHLTPTSPLNRNRPPVNNIFSNKEPNIDYSRLFVADPITYKSKAPEGLVFKNKREKTKNQKMKASHIENIQKQQQQFVRPRRYSQFVELSFKPKKNHDDIRQSSKSPQNVKQYQNLTLTLPSQVSNSDYIIRVSSAANCSEQDSSLQVVRKQLRSYITNKDQQQLGSSGQNYNIQNKGMSPPFRQASEIQFKSVNMKKKKKAEATTKTSETAEDYTFTLPNRFEGKKFVSMSRSRPKVNQNQISLDTSRNIAKSTLQNNCRGMISSCTDSGLAPIQNISKQKQRINIFQQTLDVKNIRSTVPNIKSADHRVVDDCIQPQSSTMMLLSRAKNLKQSEVLQQYGSKQQSSKLGNLKQIKLCCLKGKGTMTQSINIPSAKEKMVRKPQNNKPLTMLDMLLMKKNLQKEKNDLDMSLDLIQADEMKNSIVELDQQCD